MQTAALQWFRIIDSSQGTRNGHMGDDPAADSGWTWCLFEVSSNAGESEEIAHLPIGKIAAGFDKRFLYQTGFCF
jgi:hypothetical protein